MIKNTYESVGYLPMSHLPIGPVQAGISFLLCSRASIAATKRSKTEITRIADARGEDPWQVW